MATKKSSPQPPLPPPQPGTIVDEAALYNRQITLYRNSLAFGGIRNPTTIWTAMTRNDGLAIPYYRELEEKDTDVANCLDTLRDSVLKRDHWVTPFDDSSQAVDVANFIQAQFDGLPDFHSVLANLLDAPGYGFALSEMIFDTSMGQASLIDILDCPQELFLFGNRFYPQIGNLQFLQQVQQSEGDEVPEEKFCIFSYRPRGRDRMGRPLLRQVFWSSWFKRNMQRLWVRYAEKGPGTAVVKYQDAADAKQKAEAAEIAFKIVDQIAVGVPQTFEFVEELMKGARPIAVEVYEKFYEAMQLDIVRRCLGETLTSFGAEKGKGTQALGTVHSETLDDKSVQLAKSLAGVINRHVVRRLVTWNFGPDAPMPTFEFDTDEEKDLTERLNIDKGLQAMGLQFSESYLRDTYSVPPLEASDVIVKPTPGVTPAPPIAITPAFTEREPGEEEMAEFDALKDRLDSAATDLLTARTKEIVTALAPRRG